MTVTQTDGAVTPGRSLAQRMEALARANEIRSHRAGLKREMKHRRRSPLDVLCGDDQKVASMKLIDVLLATPKVGRVKANKLLTQAKVSPSKTVGGLTERQRSELEALLRRHALA